MLDSLAWNVMDATADDWESLEQILPHEHRYHGTADSEAVAATIVRLIAEGLMEEMRPAPVSPQAVIRQPVEVWFRMTPRGRILWETEATQHVGESKQD
jgi:hypothetical protein